MSIIHVFVLFLGIGLLATDVGFAQKDLSNANMHFTNSIGMNLQSVPPGEAMIEFSYLTRPERGLRAFRMPSNIGVGQTEVTKGQFRRFVTETGYKTDVENANRITNNPFPNMESTNIQQLYYWDNPGVRLGDDCPVVLVSYNDARAFCRWLTQKDGRYYRLPTDDEWDYVSAFEVQANIEVNAEREEFSKRVNYADQSYMDLLAERVKRDFGFEKGWEGHNDGFPLIAPVGSFQANTIGVFDLLGNVTEWVDAPDYVADANELDKLTQVDAGPVNWDIRKSLRGGNFSSHPSQCMKPNSNGSIDQSDCRWNVGFRVVVEH